jgi:hypothetical protein
LIQDLHIFRHYGTVFIKEFALILAQIAISQSFALDERQISFYRTVYFTNIATQIILSLT